MNKSNELIRTIIIYNELGERTNCAIVDLELSEYEFLSQARGTVVNVNEMTQEQRQANLSILAGFQNDPDDIKNLPKIGRQCADKIRAQKTTAGEVVDVAGSKTMLYAGGYF